jgi:phosphoglycerate dehydrogenase-like enzyme
MLCLPNDAAVAAVGELAGDVDVIVWDVQGDTPDAFADVGFWVPPYMFAPPSRETIAQGRSLEVIQLLSAGVESWLDRVPPGVTLCSGRGIHGSSTAELAVAGLLGLWRDLPRFLDAQRAHRWEPWPRTASLDGARVLVLGAGDIGRRVAAALRVFDAEVTVVARTARDGVRALDEVPQLLPQQDAVVVALPLTPATRGLVDAAFLAALPDGALLVNVARGPIVDTDALLAELQAERLRAFLDVTDPEPLPDGHPLWDAPNLLLTPHVGGGTTGWEQRAYRLAAAQAHRYLAGEPLENVVTAGY